VWRLINPIRTIHRGIARVFHISPEWGPFRYPRWLGYWPAAVSLFSFTYLELVVPDRTSTGVLVLYFLLYFQVQLTGAILFGSGWFDRGDGFEVYSSLIGRMSPLGWRDDGRLVLRNPLDGLDALKPAAGLVATVSVLLGSTAYDGFSFTRIWVQTITTSSIPPETLGALAWWASSLPPTSRTRWRPRWQAPWAAFLSVGYQGSSFTRSFRSQPDT
jgi:hypothetical protein